MVQAKASLKQRNVGIDILRVFLTFLVIIIHFGESADNCSIFSIFYRMTSCTVPVFMIISFYFTSSYIVESNLEKIKKRLIRLLIPFLFWGVFNWLIMTAAEVLFHADLINGVSSLLFQLLTGNGYRINAPLWYMMSLMIITILFTAIFKLFPKKGAYWVLAILSLTALILQYSGVNGMLFADMRFELKYSLGRFSEMLPYATIGIFFGQSNHEKIKKHRVPIAVLAGIAVIVYVIFQLSKYVPGGYGYSGITTILGAVALFLLANCGDFKHLSESRTVNIITRHTLGVYCTHYLIGNLLLIVLEKVGIHLHSIILCLIIYLLGYLASMILSKLPWKFFRMLVD